MKVSIALIIIIGNFTLIRCSKEQVPNDNFNNIFTNFFQRMNQNYVYWDNDSTNWDSLFLHYQPLFKQLDLKNENDQEQSAIYFKEITSGLLDGHFQIAFEYPKLSNIVIYPSLSRKKNDIEFHDPLNYSSADHFYFDNGYDSIMVNGKGESPEQSLQITLAKINKKIVYFRFNHFKLWKSYYVDANHEVISIMDSLFAAIAVNNLIKGVIFDLRNNDGGEMRDLNFLLGRLIKSPIHYGYSRIKNGPGRTDYSPWIKSTLTPTSNSKGFDKPIIVLIDNYSVSLAETMAIIIKTMPNGFLIGEKTWGATGPIIYDNLYNSGYFEINNFLKVYTSTAEFKYIDNSIFEGSGITPDLEIPSNIFSLNMGRDEQLDAAINQISKHQ